MKQTITFLSENIKKLGKVTVSETGSIFMDWVQSGFEFAFMGTGFYITPDLVTADDPDYLKIYIDGTPRRIALQSNKEYVIVDELSFAPHHVKVVRISKCNTSLSLKSITFFDEDATLLEKPQDASLKIHFIGDSITCGFGLLAEENAPAFLQFEQDPTRSYAGLCANMLHADVLFTSMSGKGLVANCNGDRNDITLRQAFQYTSPFKHTPWDYSKWTPDIVVINAGTNDSWGGVSDEEFQTAALAFFDEIRTVYPIQPILYAYGMMDTNKLPCIKGTVELYQKKDPNIFFLPLESIFTKQKELGALSHPNFNASLRVAPILANEIKRILKK